MQKNTTTNIRPTERPTLSNAERQQRYRSNNSQKWQARKRKDRHDNSRWRTNESYLSRPFLAWDGEGVTTNDGVHRYVMLANSTGADIIDPEGIATVRALGFLVDEANRVGDAINVIYGGGYDVNMILRDFTRTDLERIYKRKFYEWRGFRMSWRPGKSFYVCRVDNRGRKIGKGVTLYDVVSFFQCAFVKACDSYLGDKFTHRELIVENKALRSAFTLDDVDNVRRYNAAELENLVSLMVELRARLNRVGLRPSRWDGPGAIAAALLKKHGIKDHMAKTPKPVAGAARYAYAGGRFELVKFGVVPEKAYEYDIRSAYPSALRNVPSLNSGVWIHHKGDPGALPFAIYHVRYRGYRMDICGAFFRRDPNGTVCFPTKVTGWYWSPEVASGRDYCDAGYGEMEVLECWEFRSKSDVRPFDFINGLYLKRAALKRGKDGAHVGIKLGLNSLYGKLAQQVGWELTPKGLKIPPFHQLEWAGYTTSYARAKVLRAAMSNIDAVIAFETDAVFSTEPLNVPISENLGDFELKVFDNLSYVQSGLYFGDSEGQLIAKTRGVDRGSLTRETVETNILNHDAKDRVAHAKLTRFIGAGIALAQSFERWRTWETIDKAMTLEPSGKRWHLDCPACDDTPIAHGVWHETFCPLLNDAHSCEFPVEWINPDPAMIELEELRRDERFVD